MEMYITPMHFKSLLICEHAFFCTASGNISEDMIREAEKMVAKINRRYGEEILRMEHSNMNALLSEQARSEMPLRIYVPDETRLTLRTMQYLLGNRLMVIDPLCGAKEIKVRFRLRMKLSNGKGGYDYYRVKYEEEGDQFEFTRIYPLSDAEYAQMIAEIREGKEPSIAQRFTYDNEADMNRFAPWDVQIALNTLACMLEDKMPVFVEPHSYDFAQFMQALHCADQLQDVDFDEEDCDAIGLRPNSSYDTPEKRRTHIVEDYLGLWLGEYIHAHNADWEWRDRMTEEMEGEYHRLVLRNLQTMKALNPRDIIHRWMQNRDDSEILHLSEQLIGCKIVDSLDIDEAELENEAPEPSCTFALPDEDELDMLKLSFDDFIPAMLGLSFQSALSEAAQQDVQQMADSLNEQIGFEALSCILSAFRIEEWQTKHEAELNRLNELLQSAALSEKDRAVLEAEKREEEQQELDPFDLVLLATIDCKRIYTPAQLKLICKTMQKIYDRIHQELNEDQIFFVSQRVLLDDGHTWAEITLEDDEIVWRDEYCPYEGNYARLMEHICYEARANVFDVDEKLMLLLNLDNSLIENADHSIPPVCRIRALRFIELVREYFDQTIDFSLDSLSKVSLFLNAVRNALMQDCKKLRLDASPRVENMFKQLLKRENEDGALEMQNYENVLNRDIMRLVSAWLGEIFRIHCANLEWRAEIKKRDDGAAIAEPVLYNTKTKVKMFPIAFAEKFFYRHGYRLNIDDYYYSGVKRFELEPAVAHEYRFKHLPEDNLPNNILPFQP